MINAATTSESAIERFWDRFTKRLIEQGVKEKFRGRYITRAKQYIQTFSERRLATHTAEDITGYLESVGRIGGLDDWQFRQVVDAIQNLFLTAGIDSVDGVDWGYWRDSARSLPADHPTIARDKPVPTLAYDISIRPVQKQKCNSKSFLDAVRRDHSGVIGRSVTEIRRRNYSIRTEQANEAWVCRFIGSCGNHDPQDLGADRVVAFLEDLALRARWQPALRIRR